MASATPPVLFRQFFMTIPGELIEAARIDGAGPMKFFRDILLPLSRTNDIGSCSSFSSSTAGRNIFGHCWSPIQTT